MLDAAKVKGYRDGPNPAAWRGHLKLILPARQKLTRGHHAAIAINALPEFLIALRARPAIAARCLEFAILTAARSGEALGARWDEIDLGQQLGVIDEAQTALARSQRDHNHDLGGLDGMGDEHRTGTGILGRPIETIKWYVVMSRDKFCAAATQSVDQRVITGSIKLNDLRARSIKITVVVECFEPPQYLLLTTTDEPPQLQ